LLGRFLKFTEIKTKITSVFAFLISVAYLFYLDEDINWKATIVFALSMFIFDLTTTAINNYIDTKTNGQPLQFKRTTALRIIIVMLVVSTALGLYLVYLTDFIVLIAGGICFLCGVLYTYGPVPISRVPLGEVFSGIFYGFMIPFLMLYINLPEGTLFSYAISLQTISISLNVRPLLELFLLSVIPTAATANIMLANNICDVEKDIKVNRFTLPFYLGKKSLFLFRAVYYAIYADFLLMVILGILPPVFLLTLITFIPVVKNTKVFLEEQDKEKTFIVSIRNYVIIMGAATLMIFLSGLL